MTTYSISVSKDMDTAFKLLFYTPYADQIKFLYTMDTDMDTVDNALILSNYSPDILKDNAFIENPVIHLVTIGNPAIKSVLHPLLTIFKGRRCCVYLNILKQVLTPITQLNHLFNSVWLLNLPIHLTITFTDTLILAEVNDIQKYKAAYDEMINGGASISVANATMYSKLLNPTDTTTTIGLNNTGFIYNELVSRLFNYTGIEAPKYIAEIPISLDNAQINNKQPVIQSISGVDNFESFNIPRCTGITHVKPCKGEQFTLTCRMWKKDSGLRWVTKYIGNNFSASSYFLSGTIFPKLKELDK
jgi:hypothetical protein